MWSRYGPCTVATRVSPATVSDVPHLTTARRTAALAAAFGLALATGGCGTGAELPASAATASGTPEPRSAVSGGPAELPTFDPSSAVGTYAEGFPPDLFPMPEDALLLASSASPAPASQDSKAKNTPMTQVTLNLSSSLPTKKLVAQVEGILVDQDFEQIEAPDSSGLTAQTAFLRVSRTKAGEVQESLVVGVLDDGERRLASISGTVRTP
ncbi:hypothetical protein APR04_000531 [Promicromonospora umidemergens]|uniref:Lipoprotein n=1 Tax=Promicromonospora umidemergens TaxID=629679 RepID=A0ABP8X9A4_9MICO|nr:hypothetical protein [Promicromonospora umidemergens]